MTWTDWFKSIFALCLWREARGEGHDGMRAVGHVIKNRVDATYLPDQWEDIIERKWQFSSLTAVGDSQLIIWPKQPDATFEDAMLIAENIFNGGDFDITQGATHYFANTIPMPSWAVNMMETIKLGHHTFYK